MKPPLFITDSAREMVQSIMGKKGIPKEYLLRIGVKGGAGCFGVNYLIGFDKKRESDEEYLISEIRVLIEKKQLMFVLGITLDYVSNGEQSGFTFIKE